jgi:NADH:ubiquinone oxidoreductase subunit 6 (subunit J)
METFFYVFFTLALLSSLLVVFSTNPVHSVLSLIVVFCTTSMLLLLLRVDFLALLLVVVYVGAIAVLFLFVVMMLNIKLVQLNESFLRWLPLGLVVVFALVTEIFYVFSGATGGYDQTTFVVFSLVQRDLISVSFDFSWINNVMGLDSLAFLGSSLYSYFAYSLILGSFVLLTSLMGAIALTVGAKRVSRRQYIYKQVNRDVFGSISFYK